MTSHVKIRAVPLRVQYIADGMLTEYEFPFAIFKTSDINVYFGDSLQDISIYNVSEASHSEGGTVTFNSAPENGTVITIVRNLSIERTTDFQEGGALRASVLNDELDYQIACQQQIADNLNRSMVLPPYAIDTDVDLTLPKPSAGKAIVWNKDGTNLENSAVEVNALESTLKDYKTVAQNAAATATEKADIASEKADIATGQAQIATQKAEEVTQKLGSKADVDLTNLSTDGKTVVANLAMHDYSAGITISANTDYVTPYNGFLIITLQSGGQGNYQVNVNGNVVIRIGVWDSEADYRSITLPVAKDDIIRTDCYAAIFYPCIGG